MSKDGEADFSKSTCQQLEEGLRNIDATVFPLNHANLKRELAARSAESTATPLFEAIPLALVTDSGTILSCLRFFVFHYMLRYFGWQLTAGFLGGLLMAAQFRFQSAMFVPAVAMAISALLILPVRYLWSALLIARNAMFATLAPSSFHATASQVGIDLEGLSQKRVTPWADFSDIIEAPTAYLLVTANHGSFVAFEKKDFPEDLINRLKVLLQPKA